MLTPEAVLPSLLVKGADYGIRSARLQIKVGACDLDFLPSEPLPNGFRVGSQREHPRRRRGHDPAESEPFGVFHGSPSAASASSASRLSSQKR